MACFLKNGAWHWETAYGKEIALKDMDTQHLDNCIRTLEKYINSKSRTIYPKTVSDTMGRDLDLLKKEKLSRSIGLDAIEKIFREDKGLSEWDRQTLNSERYKKKLKAYYPSTGMSDVHLGKLANEMFPKIGVQDIDHIVFNYPATIVIFRDGTKEVVKVSDDDEYQPEVGVAMAIVNKMFGSRSRYKKFIKKFDTYDDLEDHLDSSSEELKAVLDRAFDKIRKGPYA